LEGYGSFEGVAKGSSEVYYHLLKNGGQVFVNSKDELLMRMTQRFEKRILYPQLGDDYHAEIANQDFYISIKTETGTVFTTKLIGAFNFDNAALALCIGKYFGVPEADANAAIADYTPSNNRSQVMQKDSNTIIMDAYNANPSSMGLSVSNFGLMTATNKVAILGDMYELGDYSDDEHKKMITLAENCKLTKVIFCGKEFYKHKNDSSLFFESRDELSDYLTANPFHNTNILLKGSRGMALERLIINL
jgi:UDP-N-acetylmuramoyl-tripeptide--D-alanyl-D-alanine ligase